MHFGMYIEPNVHYYTYVSNYTQKYVLSANFCISEFFMNGQSIKT